MDTFIKRHLLIRIISVFLLLGIGFSKTNAQSTRAYIIEFTDKNQSIDIDHLLSKKAITRRAKYGIPLSDTDYPVNPSYIGKIHTDTSIHYRYSLKWLNSIVVSSDNLSLNKILALPFVRQVNYIGKVKKTKELQNPKFVTPQLKLKENDMTVIGLSEADYGKSYLQNKQIGVIDLHKKGVSGIGVDIAVFDAGFKNIHKIPSFQKHQANGLLTYGYDVAGLDNTLYDSDNHGTAVSSCLGAYDKSKYIGTSPNAHLFLFRTEVGATEYTIEELNWCKAAELADSIGVDMITSSLGYYEYDDKNLSYSHANLDGNTSYIAKSATIAVQKGIFVLNSAGNSGDNKWRKIGTPADVATVLVVGAVDINNKYGSFSSQGNNTDGVIKPDVAALGVKATVASTSGGYYQGYGTSYATPIAAGGVACLIQAFPEMSPIELCTLIRNTATNASAPDSLVGYGVAQFDVAYTLQNLRNNKSTVPNIIKTGNNHIYIYVPQGESISYKIQYLKPFLGIFKIKKTVAKGTKNRASELVTIAVNSNKLNCNKKYTIKIDVLSNGNTQHIEQKNISMCPL